MSIRGYRHEKRKQPIDLTETNVRPFRRLSYTIIILQTPVSNSVSTVPVRLTAVHVYFAAHRALIWSVYCAVGMCLLATFATLVFPCRTATRIPFIFVQSAIDNLLHAVKTILHTYKRAPLAAVRKRSTSKRKHHTCTWACELVVVRKSPPNVLSWTGITRARPFVPKRVEYDITTRTRSVHPRHIIP